MNSGNEEPLVFDCAGDGLVGILHRGSGPDARPGVLVVVGGPQYRVGSHRQFVLMARDLAAAGYPVLRFDYRGMGDAEGAVRSFEQVEEDIRAAVAAFRAAVPGLRRVVLWGLCDAASAILMLNPAPSGVAGKVLVNPWARTGAGEARAYVRHYYLRRIVQRDFWRKLGSGALDLPNAISQFIGALRRSRAKDDAASSYVDRMLHGALAFHGPTLVMLSGSDLTAREFEDLLARDAGWRRAMERPAVAKVRLQQADHTFSRGEDLRHAVSELIRWLETIPDEAVCR
jgi:exosortase A-associated hydrolase 1